MSGLLCKEHPNPDRRRTRPLHSSNDKTSWGPRRRNTKTEGAACSFISKSHPRVAGEWDDSGQRTRAMVVFLCFCVFVFFTLVAKQTHTSVPLVCLAAKSTELEPANAPAVAALECGLPSCLGPVVSFRLILPSPMVARHAQPLYTVRQDNKMCRFRPFCLVSGVLSDGLGASHGLAFSHANSWLPLSVSRLLVICSVVSRRPRPTHETDAEAPEGCEGTEPTWWPGQSARSPAADSGLEAVYAKRCRNGSRRR